MRSGESGEVRIGRRSSRRASSTIRSFLTTRKSFASGRTILGIVDGRRARIRGPSRRAPNIRRDSRRDRDAHSDVPHLRAGRPSWKAPRLRTGTPRRRSGHRLRRNGPTRPCPSSRSWRSARRSRAEPSRRRVSDPLGSEGRAKRKRPTTLSATEECALRTVTARQTLPEIFRRRCCPRKPKSWRAFPVSPSIGARVSRARPVRVITHKPRSHQVTSVVANACSRRRVVAATRSCASIRPRRYVLSLRRRGRARRRLTRTGVRDRSYPKAVMPTLRVPAEEAARSTRDRSGSRVSSARAPATVTTTRHFDARRRVARRASSVPRDAR